MARKITVRKLSITTNIKPSKKGWKVVFRGKTIHETSLLEWAIKFVNGWNDQCDKAQSA